MRRFNINFVLWAIVWHIRPVILHCKPTIAGTDSAAIPLQNCKHYGNNQHSIFARIIGNRHSVCHRYDMWTHRILRHLRRHDLSRRCVCRTPARHTRPADRTPHRITAKPHARVDASSHYATPSAAPPLTILATIGTQHPGIAALPP